MVTNFNSREKVLVSVFKLEAAFLTNNDLF